MKLNMIVVITMWLPRLACSQAGIKAQAAPKAAAASVATISATDQCGNGMKRQASATPSPPTIACPSPPMLNILAWKATATQRPVKMKLVV